VTLPAVSVKPSPKELLYRDTFFDPNCDIFCSKGHFVSEQPPKEEFDGTNSQSINLRRFANQIGYKMATLVAGAAFNMTLATDLKSVVL
jgi:hypothetical protein